MTDPIRARLDEHRMYRSTCIGCTRRFGGYHDDCSVPEVAALRAVLDLCDWIRAHPQGPQAVHVGRVEDAIADALGVTDV